MKTAHGAAILRVGIFLVLLLGFGWELQASGVDLRQITPERVRAFVLSFGIWAPAMYFLVYAQPIIPLPATALTMAGGLAFGPLWGTLAALGGASVRGCGQFLIARLFGREAVAGLLKGRAAAIDQRVEVRAFSTVLLIRLIPNVPFDLQNYGLGFSRIRFGTFAWASLIGIVPGIFVNAYLGYSLTDLRQAWKLALAILLIVGLVFGQRWLARRG